LSDYEYSNSIGVGTSSFDITSGIKDLNFKMDFQYFTNSQSMLKFGINSIYHTFLPGTVTAGSTSFTNSLTIENRYALENAAYFSHELDIVSGVKLNYGMRFSVFSLLGPAHIYSYDASGAVIDTATYQSGDVIKTYTNLEPRISANISLDETSSIKASYTRTTQYLHLLSNSTTSNPSDLWVPSSNNVKPQLADQYDLGYFRNFNDNQFEASFEL
jgi:hypothetical protein